ncbi:hypothetical protein RDWZM_005462 [Blomia tropicalis]|uniref:Transcription initiation factor TFIID subunit 12 n=1 Tax=Blomia tropicalis TaxID=40697 RepID=A0A9Q0M9K0_BLOTA|nr:Transcription initiation factor TFIID subunit 12 [Blomia tropicalis]KAJ6219650.1 hypothetical protein RDWZM_005462 [Blomia tropicalis]
MNGIHPNNVSLEQTNNDNSNTSMANGQSDSKEKMLALLQKQVSVLDRKSLQELVQEVDPNEQLEEEVEDVLLSLADDFIESLVMASCVIAKHRCTKDTDVATLEVSDVQLALEKNWNMWIPGFGVDGVVGVLSGTAGIGSGSAATSAAVALAKPKKSLMTEAHKQRLALIKKTLKKF